MGRDGFKRAGSVNDRRNHRLQQHQCDGDIDGQSQHTSARLERQRRGAEPVVPNTTTPQGNTAARIFGSYFEDPSATVGIAVSGVTGT